MSLRHPGAHAEAPVAAPTRMTAVLAAGQREMEATGGFFGKPDPLDKFRKAVTERDDQKAKEKLNKAIGNLSPAQSRALASEFAKAEASAWERVAEIATYADYHKERKANTDALAALLKAQAGLGALHEYDPHRTVSAMPNRPDLPEIFKYHLWPSYRVKKGTEPWSNYRRIRDAWKRAEELVITVGHRK
jgi:hypothetical protein